MGETAKTSGSSITSNFYLQTLEHSDRIRHLANFHLTNFKASRQNTALSKALTGRVRFTIYFEDKVVRKERERKRRAKIHPRIHHGHSSF